VIGHQPSISFVVAMALNDVIGRNNALPWHLPADLKHFKEVTMGKPILMGRKTFASIGRALPGRVNIVLTRDTHWSVDGVAVVHSVPEALEVCRDAPELAVIGGAEVFQLLLASATRIHLTRIQADVPGDARFPRVDWSHWKELDSRRLRADERNAYDMTFSTLQRVP